MGRVPANDLLFSRAARNKVPTGNDGLIFLSTAQVCSVLPDYVQVAFMTD